MRTNEAAGRVAYILLGAVVFAAGCSTARRDDLVSMPAHRASSQVAMGERVFASRCNQCHPGGAAGLGPAINDKPLPGFMIAFQVRHGLGAMPRFSRSQLSDRQLDTVVAYLKNLKDRPLTLARSK